MDAVVLQQRTLEITKTYSHIIGIWPDQKKSKQYFIWTILYFFVLSNLCAQIARVIWFFDMDTVTKQLYPLGTLIMILIKHGVYIVKNSKFKVLLDDMLTDLETYKTKEELAVMTPYMNRAIFMATFYKNAAIICVIVLIQIPLLPLFADIVMPLNETRPRLCIFPVYYHFSKMNDNDYLPLIHADIAIIAIMCVSVACDTFYIFTAQHACGLFAIAGYRFKSAIKDIHDKQNIAEMSNETYKKICHSIMAHDRAIRHVKEIDSFYETILFLAVSMTIISFCCVLFRVSKMKASAQFYTYAIYAFAELGHLFFLTLQGQFVNNITDSFYDEVYAGQWYNSVPKTQALFILALRAAIDPPEITAGGFITINLQTFAEVIKLSFSYYTVLQSA
ncbi:odorant receptor Or1-like [Megachile rotundata]|uniref:odorant receptor Or1-like n=1 Tax=Megachile rotundata TaxID=143995 RepID=UPI003FD1C2EB